MCDFNCVTLPIMFMQHHRNTVWRMLTEVYGAEHQRGLKGAPCPAHVEGPTLLLTCFTNEAEVLFRNLRMTSAVMRQLAEKYKLDIAWTPLSFHFSFLLFLMNLAS